MPFVEVKSIRGVFSAEEKTRVIEESTGVFARIKGRESAEGTWVVINELGDGNWGAGGAVLEYASPLITMHSSPTQVSRRLECTRGHLHRVHPQPSTLSAPSSLNVGDDAHNRIVDDVGFGGFEK